MSLLRKILYPLSILYGEVTSARNVFYDKGILKSTSFSIPTIVVGNLSVGGTGKTPQVEYLVRLLQDSFKIAILSRGYKRKTKGFLVADANTSAQDIGDEPKQYYSKFKDIIVAVDSDRVNGVTQLSNLKDKPDVILLDDAYQHRKIEAGFNILLTSYDKLYVDDNMLPTGNLREKVEGASRAQIIIVTKCPEVLSEKEQFNISKKLNIELHQTIFFTKIKYADKVIGKTDTLSIDNLSDYKIILVTGIAKTKPLLDFFDAQKLDYKHLKFSDHHHFSNKDFQKIRDTYSQYKTEKKCIITTEKDYVRSFSNLNDNIYYLPIETQFIDHQADFNQLIINYVGESTGNR